MTALARFLCALLVVATMLAAAQASAQPSWPERPIKLIVPFAPGGSNDTLARALATHLATRLAQPVIIENKGGGGGVIGIDFVAKAQPDGYTLLLVSQSLTSITATGRKLPYDALKDLQPIGEIGTGEYAIVVSNSLEVRSLRDLIQLARAKPNRVSYGTSGIGGLNHLGTELFAQAANVQLVHVPYKGIGPAFTDLMGGTLDMALPSIASVAQHIHSGKMRGLAVTGTSRSPLAPELPTVAEAGLPGFQLETWWGLFGPAGLPANILTRLNRELNDILALPAMRDLLGREGVTPKPTRPDEFGALIRSDLARWRKLITERQIQVE